MNFPTSKTTTHSIRLELGEGLLEGEVELPEGFIPLSEFALRVVGISGVVSDMAGRVAERAGKEISCRKGCGACCRQLVPISPAEALHIAELVDSMPPQLKARIERRFEKVRDRLDEVGMVEKLSSLGDGDLSDEAHRDITREYFKLGIPCPFLNDESCMIHDYRPSICREYLVTSPAELCKDPYSNSVEGVPVSIRLSQALARVSAGAMARKPELIPLSMALGWVGESGNGEARLIVADSAKLLEAFLEQMQIIIDDGNEPKETKA